MADVLDFQDGTLKPNDYTWIVEGETGGVLAGLWS